MRRLFFLALPLLCMAANTESSKQELRELGLKIKQEREAIVGFERKEHALLDQLDAIEKELVDSRLSLQSMQNSLSEVLFRAQSLKAEADQLRSEMGSYLGSTKQKLITLYKVQRHRGIAAAFSGRGYNDLVRNNRTIERIIDSDLESVLWYSERLGKYRQKTADFEEETRKFSALKDTLHQREQEAEQKKLARQEFLAKLRSEKAQHELLLRELEDSAKELSSMIFHFQKSEPSSPTAGIPFGQMRGKLPLPLQACRLITKFGKNTDPLYHSETTSKGIELQADLFSKVRAVAAGKIIFARWFQGYGKLLIIDHGQGYYSVYAHLADLEGKEGSQIATGTTIGTLGDTGSYKGSYLYFELRHFGKNLDPVPWFKQDLLAVRKP